MSKRSYNSSKIEEKWPRLNFYSKNLGGQAKKYTPQNIEKKWQRNWQKQQLYKTPNFPKEKKFYVLDMFPYPSGEGLHVGHLKGYIATDIVARLKMMQGYSVLHPMGWDAFGLPAENYAIAHKIHPSIAIQKNIKRFKKQLAKIGFTYDWSREINTTDPNYYKYTQWIFLKMLEKGLAYESYEPINWCPSCQTGLANEDLENGRCERCGSKIERKPMRQWILKMTVYADRLLQNLKLLDWDEAIIEQQKNWIGRSEGGEIRFLIADSQLSINVFTTRADTIFGATYMVLAPEHPLIKNLKSKISNYQEVKKYIEVIEKESELERIMIDKKEKTGVELKGIMAINPANNQKIPIWISDYVLMSYGAGAVMAVPAHDQRDFKFAEKFDLPMKAVICPIQSEPAHPALEKSFEGEGVLVDSGQFTDLLSKQARKEIIIWLAKKGLAKKTVYYKLRDWVFSRQRYWGEPIPVVHCKKCGVVPLKDKDLPLKLPKVKYYQPAGTGESPLANIKKWVNTKCPKCNGPAERETNTMPQWAGSCWYYLRYIDPKNKKTLVDRKKERSWMGKRGVDLYVGGAEHATRHLLYARFWHKFLYDLGVVSTKEPFQKLINVGLIAGEDGRKMSKRWKNVINPDDMVAKFGADSLRIYEMFMGPFAQNIAWSTAGVSGARRFLEKVYNLRLTTLRVVTRRVRVSPQIQNKENEKLNLLLHKTIKKVTEDIENFHFNTAISEMMIFINRLEEEKEISLCQFSQFLILLSPFAPHLAEELWQRIGHPKSIFLEKWPKYNQALIQERTIQVIIQVNGKLRDQIEAALDTSEDEIKRIVLEREKVKKWLTGKEIKKIIFVPGKLINLVV